MSKNAGLTRAEVRTPQRLGTMGRYQGVKRRGPRRRYEKEFRKEGDGGEDKEDSDGWSCKRTLAYGQRVRIHR